MTPLEAIALGILQGLTEFLPVSSSGHLVLAQAVLGIELPGVLFEVAVHVATLCAVVWVYRKRVGELARGALTGERASLAYVGLLLLASVPAGLAGVLAANFIEAQFERPLLTAGLLLVTGAIIYTLRWTVPRAQRPLPGPWRALAVGASQAAAILPGISRSGATLAAGTGLGVEPVRMAEFSFLLSVPAIAGAAVLQAGEFAVGVRDVGTAALALGFAAALLAGVAAIRLFVHMLRTRTFHRFAYYCWAVGLVYLAAAAAMPELRG